MLPCVGLPGGGASSAPNLVRHQGGGDHGSGAPRSLGATLLVQIWAQLVQSSTSFVEQRVDFAPALYISDASCCSAGNCTVVGAHSNASRKGRGKGEQAEVPRIRLLVFTLGREEGGIRGWEG